jgi:DNA-binding MarR family transcriptional regulator
MRSDPSLPPAGVDAAGAPAPATSELRMSLFRLARRLRAERADDSLSDAQFAVLAHLSIHGAHTLGALAERERVSPPSMNRTVNCLEESGYLRREGDPDDGRRVRILLTDSGADLVAETVRRRDAWLDAALDELDPDARDALLQMVPILQALANR